MSDMAHITRTFESLSALSSLDAGFLHHILLRAIDDPVLATNTALAEHLALVPRVVGLLQPSLVRLMVDDAHPGLAKVTADLVALVAGRLDGHDQSSKRSNVGKRRRTRHRSPARRTRNLVQSAWPIAPPRFKRLDGAPEYIHG